MKGITLDGDTCTLMVGAGRRAGSATEMNRNRTTDAALELL
jgi:hypothetical protein